MLGDTLDTTVDIRIRTLAERTRDATVALANTGTEQRNAGLRSMAAALRDRGSIILEANAADVEMAAAKGTASAMLDRLRLDHARIGKMAAALDELVTLPDPIGSTDSEWTRPNGLRIGRRRIPLGVIGIIYEARPNVTSDAAGLCFKSGNGVVLKGGSEALRSNAAIVGALRDGLDAVGLPGDAIGFIDDTDRDAVRALLELEDLIDLVIPRGGEGLIRFVSQTARMPVIKHYKGVCHIYLDASATAEMAIPIVLNAKVQRPSVCNAVETLLVHRDAAPTLLPAVAEALYAEGVTLHADPISRGLLGEHPYLRAATEDDWHAEYLSLDLAVCVVGSLDEAATHIRRYGSQHTEAIVTQDYATAERFLAEIDSSTVLVNASTRFADGGQLGLGAEIGISTTKLHAFGPMGLKELTTTKFVVYGTGQVRA